MRIEDGHKRCVMCNAILDVAERAVPASHIEDHGGTTERVLTVGGVEIHRCDVSALQRAGRVMRRSRVDAD